MFESIFYPSWSGERFTPADEVFTDFAVPHVAECILGKTASLAPRFKHHAKAFSVLQIRLICWPIAVKLPRCNLMPSCGRFTLHLRRGQTQDTKNRRCISASVKGEESLDCMCA